MPQLGGESVASSTGCVDCEAEGGEKQSRRGDGGWAHQSLDSLEDDIFDSFGESIRPDG